MRGQRCQALGTSALLCAASLVTRAPWGSQAGSETVGLFPQEECAGRPHVRQGQAGPQGCFCSLSPSHTLEVTWQPEKKCPIIATSFCPGGPDLPKEFSFWALPLGRKQIGLHHGCPTGFIVPDQDV